ncbi:MAG: LPS export ABC transporter periplasmic protein LptC [Rectinemataceae bacterium]
MYSKIRVRNRDLPHTAGASIASIASIAKIAGCVAAAVALAALSGCSFDYGASAPGGPDIPEAVFRGFERTEITSGKVTFKARAELAEYFGDGGKYVISGLSFEELDPDTGKMTASGEAEKAIYYEESGDAEFSGYIRLYSAEENASFETDRLKYSGATQTLEGAPESTVLIKVGETLFMRGKGFFADVDEKIFSLREDVEGTIWNK